MLELILTLTVIFQGIQYKQGRTQTMERDISTFWSLMVELGFFGWIGSTIAFIFNGISKDNKLIKGKAFFWGILIVLFYAVWIAGMKKA